MVEMSSIGDNLLRVLERMNQAAARAGRDPGEIKLVAVSKTIETARIRQAIEAGVTILGENYVQEARQKIEEIGHGIQWHMVGHLQSNKAKYAVTLFDYIHSVDGIPLAREIDRRAAQKGKMVRVLLEVNLSGETSKFGMGPKAAMELIHHVSALKHICIEGLMTMPPYFDEPEKARPYFIRLRELRDRIQKEGIEGVRMDELSMGMSGDFEAAIEEGATMIRVGTAIFGERGY
ncbi:MAG: YggS family pyridoxal phosphate-dependent enzyme [Syntrophobacterales bacterium]|nr:MAG: YggS family pyridoxal phosphate-dependent enzyme [Syntrophobacterales bacterium]